MRLLSLLVVGLLAGSAAARPPHSDLPVQVFRSRAAAHALGLHEPRHFDFKHWMLVWIDNPRTVLGEVEEATMTTVSATAITITIVNGVSHGNCPDPCCGGDRDLYKVPRARRRGAVTGTLYRLPRSPLPVVVSLVTIDASDDCKAP